MKYSLKSEALPLIAILLSWIAALYFFSNFPDTVITHWNFYGEPDGFSNKYIGAFLLPGIISGMYLLFLGLPFVDPKKERYENFTKPYFVIRTLLILFLIAIYFVSGFVNLGYPIKINVVIPTMIGILFLILGNYMGKIKQNWFVGFRLPWTLASENVWNKTNRFGGWSLMTFGLLIIISPQLPKTIGYAVFIIGIMLVTIVTAIYSYLVYRQEQKQVGN